MWKWLLPPQRSDEYERFGAQVLHWTLVLLAGVSFSTFLFTTSSLKLVLIPAALALFGVCYYLLHSGRLRAASFIFLGGFWLIITAAALNLNGLLNATVSSYAIIIIFSVVLFSRRAVVVFTAMSLLSTILLMVGEQAGILPFQTAPLSLPDRFIQLIALFSAAGILLAGASSVITSSFRRIRDQQQTLVERNRELEQQIVERELTEANLRISEERYRLLFENTPIMAAIYGRDGEVVLVNNATAQTMGGTPETLQGRNMRDIIPAADAERGIQIHAKVMAEGVPLLGENKVTLPSGRDFYYLRHVMPLPNPDGAEATQVLVLTADLTEKHLAELRERELVLAHEKNAFLNDFFSTLSHDLKTPLAIMKTSLYLLERAQTEQQRAERTQRISEQIGLMDNFIQDMLTISRLEHLPSLNFETLYLNPLVEEITELLRPRMERKHLSYQFNGQPDLPAIRGDQDQLRRMLTNLIENAVNYTPNGGEVIVNTHQSDGRVAFEVKDSGIGIEPEAVPHIFERFFRAPNAKASESTGTGLGLAIVKKIADTHTATIEVDSQVGAGTTFCVEFPGAQ